jgi:hypothetical protein
VLGGLHADGTNAAFLKNTYMDLIECGMDGKAFFEAMGTI